MFLVTTPPMMRSSWLAVICILLASSVALAQMPYNPTRVLLSDNLAYIFKPSSQNPNQFELGSVDVSSRIEASDLPYTTLYYTLPFLKNGTSRAFTPILDEGGNLTVYTGDCSQGASGGEVWSYVSSQKQHGWGSWEEQDVSVKNSAHTAVMGANYLSGGMTFSSIVGGDASSTGAYFFGGMCPYESQNDNWQSAANYSNLMVTLQPTGTGVKDITYNLDVSSSRGPPVPEAGFSMTGLTPTFSNRSDGTRTQQQNFLLIGGHTSAAFINMSQVALFSLPEQGWTFIGIDAGENSRSDLTLRTDTPTLDPRSGHTAVLTPDGQRIIVFGGWVGDVNTPAEPQLVVLNVADGYGGKGTWQWIAPSTLGVGPANNAGLYGHGAAMLPGGVMMISGGYLTSTPSTRHKRTTPTINSKSYFLNVTSNTWTTDYSPPSRPSTSQPTNNGPLSTPGQKVGLGVGVGLGLAAVCSVFAFYMWYTRRLKRQREMREKQIQNLAFTTHRSNLDGNSPGFDGRGDHTDSLDYRAGQNNNYYFPPGTQGGQGWRQANSQDVERTGLLVEIPSPTRGLRRSLSGRPGYAMGRINGPGNIHPIDEIEEEQDDEQVTKNLLNKTQHEMTERRVDRVVSVLDDAPVLDPFVDAHGHHGEARNNFHSAPTSPIREEHISPVWPLGAAMALHSHPTGRISPDKSSSDRTGSNLSERSTRSDLTWNSSSGGLGRSSSMRSAAILNHANHANPFRTPGGSPTRDRSDGEYETGRHTPLDPRTQSFTSIRSNGYVEVDSFRTAQSSFAHLQAEGEALLGGNPERPRPGTSSSGSNTYRDTERSNSRAATATPATSFALDFSNPTRPATRERRKSWLGSVRKALTRSASSAERTRSLTTTMSYYERYTDNPTSPTEASMAHNRKSFPASAPPRRAASDASFWKNKRGQQDWLDDEQDPTWKRAAGDDWGAPEDVALAQRERLRQEWRERGNLLADTDQPPTPGTPITGDQLGIPISDKRPSTPASEADWDVEAAVERRVVQVMFTVPKSKLRVVNADVDGSSILTRENSTDDLGGESGSPSSRVKDLAGRFEQMSSPPRGSPRASPVPSPSSSIKSVKVRQRASEASLRRKGSRLARRRNGDGDGEEW